MINRWQAFEGFPNTNVRLLDEQVICHISVRGQRGVHRLVGLPDSYEDEPPSKLRRSIIRRAQHVRREIVSDTADFILNVAQ